MPEHPWGEKMASNLWWNLNTGEFRLAGLGWEKYRAMGCGEGSVFADPMFFDPAMAILALSLILPRSRSGSRISLWISLDTSRRGLSLSAAILAVS